MYQILVSIILQSHFAAVIIFFLLCEVSFLSFDTNNYVKLCTFSIPNYPFPTRNLKGKIHDFPSNQILKGHDLEPAHFPAVLKYGKIRHHIFVRFSVAIWAEQIIKPLPRMRIEEETAPEEKPITFLYANIHLSRDTFHHLGFL